MANTVNHALVSLSCLSRRRSRKTDAGHMDLKRPQSRCLRFDQYLWALS